MKPLSFHPDIVSDIKGSYEWYEEKLQGLGDSYLDELEDGYTAIQNFPETWATFQYGFKRYILNRFPFSIIYKSTEKEIFIIAVMHNSRRPNYWLDRIS
ncbi:MAG: type II toxin-antitoxin system RelE/ParE family toxin [Campylobacterota bacterium]|nr:type II toxin-antitoxin system RelE/ParE family toxin [Campylobacterota bacterium]